MHSMLKENVIYIFGLFRFALPMTTPIKNQSIAATLLLAIFAANVRGQPPQVGTVQSADSAFHGEVYRSSDGQYALNLISASECEYSQGTNIILGNYSKQGNTLRVVVTFLGTNQVMYFQFIDVGLQRNDGVVLLSPQSQEKLKKLQEDLEKKSLAMRDEGMEIVRRFFTKGAVIKAYYQGSEQPFQVTLTSEVIFSPKLSAVTDRAGFDWPNGAPGPYDQYFAVDGHMIWLGDPHAYHSFTSFGYDADKDENYGKFIGQVAVVREGDKCTSRVVANFGVIDPMDHRFQLRGGLAVWNGKEFSGANSHRFYREKSESLTGTNESNAAGVPPNPSPVTRQSPQPAESVAPRPQTDMRAKNYAEAQDLPELQKLDEVERRLNEVYSRLRKQLDARGKEALKREELDWLKRRDAWIRGNSNNVAASIPFTEQRIQELEKRIRE